MKLVLSTILIAAVIAVASAKSLKQGRIIGGIPAVPNSRPYQVYMHMTSSTDIYVGAGSLISPNYVLSAAIILYKANSVLMFFGKHNITYVEDTELQVTSTNIIIHDKWDQNSLNNDIALIKLPTPIEFTPAIAPIKLPKLSDIGNDYLYDEVTVSGWGKTASWVTKPSEVLMQVQIVVQEKFFCELMYPGYVHQSLCTMGFDSHENAKGICTGDNGSPLIKDGVQIGVANLANSYGCEEGWPSVHTRVWSYLDWIADNTDVVIEP